MIPFLLGLFVGFICLWFDRRRRHHSLTTYKNRLSQEQYRYQQLDQNYQRLSQRYKQLEQEFFSLQNTQSLIQEPENLNQLYQEVIRNLQRIQQENQKLQGDYNYYKQCAIEAEEKLRLLQQEFFSLQNTQQILVQEQAKLTQKLKQQAQENQAKLTQQLEQQAQENQKLQENCNYYEQCTIEAEAKSDLLQQENSKLQSQIQEHQYYYQPYDLISKSAQHSPVENGKVAAVNQIILCSHEPNLYPDELYEMILNILQEELHRIPQEYKRRQHLLQSLLEHNHSPGNQASIKQQIERLFFEYTGTNKRLERELNDLGFSFIESTNHYKIIWHNDSRYVFSFAKTPSDHRAGRNIYRDLIHLLF